MGNVKLSTADEIDAEIDKVNLTLNNFNSERKFVDKYYRDLNAFNVAKELPVVLAALHGFEDLTAKFHDSGLSYMEKSTALIVGKVGNCEIEIRKRFPDVILKKQFVGIY